MLGVPGNSKKRNWQWQKNWLTSLWRRAVLDWPRQALGGFKNKAVRLKVHRPMRRLNSPRAPELKLPVLVGLVGSAAEVCLR